jgi:hypothetical protein
MNINVVIEPQALEPQRQIVQYLLTALSLPKHLCFIEATLIKHNAQV